MVEIVSCYLLHASLQLTIALPVLQECWDHGWEPPHLTTFWFLRLVMLFVAYDLSTYFSYFLESALLILVNSFIHLLSLSLNDTFTFLRLDEFFLWYVLKGPVFFFITPFAIYVWNNLLSPLKAGSSFVLLYCYTSSAQLYSYFPHV